MNLYQDVELLKGVRKGHRCRGSLTCDVSLLQHSREEKQTQESHFFSCYMVLMFVEQPPLADEDWNNAALPTETPSMSQ